MSKSFESIKLVVGGTGAGNYYQLQDRMRGFKIDKQLTPSEITTFTCEITLDNDDGAFTPGGGGTYSNLDWFNSFISITRAQVNDFTAPTSIFSWYFGVVDNLEIIDDGVTSTIELSCVDLLTVAARTPALGSISVSGTDEQNVKIYDLLGTVINGYYGGTAALPEAPGFGPIYRISVSKDSPDTNLRQDGADVDTTGNSIDALTESILPSQYCVLWPYQVADAQSPYSGTWFYLYYVGKSGYRKPISGSSVLKDVYDFVEGSPASGEIPITSIDLGYRLDRIINSVEATNVSTSTELEAYNTDSIKSYGARTMTLQTMIAETDAAAQNSINNWANRFATARYGVRSVTVDGAAVDFVDDSTTLENFRYSMSMGSLWRRATVTYTPRGAASSVTEYCVISGTTIEATPGNIRCTYHLLPSADYQSLVLDSTSLGVLDQNRLG